MRRRRREALVALVFVGPWIAGLLLFQLYPFVMSFYYSLTDFNPIRKPEFVGFENYAWLLEDDMFWKSLWNTLFFVILGVPLDQVVALSLAAGLHGLRKSRLMRFLRGVYFFPILVPEVVMALVWMLMLNSEFGIVNQFLKAIGIDPPAWFLSTSWAKPTIVFLRLFFVGTAMVVYLSALNEVPREIEEAALIDGAGRLTRFWKITIPMISPVILFNFIMDTIGTFQIFTEPFVITKGGPARSTYTLTMFIYTNAFEHLDMGYASAAAWLTFALIFITTILILYFTSKKVYYGGGGV